MTEKYRDTYRSATARLQGWNYGWNAAYFITICIQNKEPFFGEIADYQFIPSSIGQIAQTCWDEIPTHFPFVELDASVIMPNHVHGIVVINKNNHNVGTRLIASLHDDKLIASLHDDKLIEINGGVTGVNNPMLQENLSRVIRWYKGRVTFESRKIDAGFAWQPRFYDHIIRDQKSYKSIRQYIFNNIKKWQDDELNQ